MSTARQFHEATKYAPATVGQHPGLDWSKQPKPFKTFLSEERIDLTPHLLIARDERTEKPVLMPIPPGPIDIAKLSTLLLHTFGVTAVMQDGLGQRHYFRAAPSAGALYPTEIYVAVRGIEGIPDGIHDYQVKDHALAPVSEGDFSRDLGAIAFENPSVLASRCVFLFGAVWYRSAWRYMDRAYRRILLDTGHAIGNLALLAPELGLRAPIVADFNDAALSSLLLLDDRQEAVLALVPIVEAEVQVEAPKLRRSAAGLVEAESLIVAVHRAGTLDGQEPLARDPDRPDAADGEAPIALPADAVDFGSRLAETILERRSSRQFTGGPIPFEELAAVLRFAYSPAFASPADPAASTMIAPRRLSTWIAANRVSGLVAGLYHFDPASASLRMLRPGASARECHRLTLGQDLGHDAACVVFHTCRLDRMVKDFGDRGYRHLSLDAGHIGERLNLAALRLGLGASGIGGYFDDEINTLFAFPPEEAVVYVTCLGQPPQEF